MRSLRSLLGRALHGVSDRRSLRRLLLVFIIPIVVLFTILITGFSSIVSTRIAMNEATSRTRDLQSQICLSLHYFIEQLYNVMETPQYDHNFIITCRDAVNRPGASAANDSYLFRYLHQIYSSNPYIETVAFIMRSGQYMSLGYSLFDPRHSMADIMVEDWYRRTVEANGTILWHDTTLVPSILKPYLMCSRQIWDTKTQDTLGILFIALNPDMLHDQYKDINLVKDNVFVIADALGHVISSSDDSLKALNVNDVPAFRSVIADITRIATARWRGERVIIVGNSVSAPNWRIISILPQGKVMAAARKVVWFNAIVSACVIGLFLVFIGRFSLTVTNPLNALIDTMREVRKGDLDISVKPTGYREIRLLCDTFNAMTADIRRLLQEVYASQEEKHQWEIKVARSELKALQSQINPHFIYNTLDSINTIAKMNGDGEASAAIISLSKFLRISLSHGSEIIPVRHELEMIRAYASIQRLNCPGPFSCAVDVDESLLECAIVKCTLQPLLENAVFHGFASLTFPGEIRVSGTLSAGTILFTVSDNGVGMSDERLQAVNAALEDGRKGSASPREESFGILNVDSRLKLYFGASYGLRYARAPGGGVVVTVSMPAFPYKAGA